jgi:GTP cyclohydrolase I
MNLGPEEAARALLHYVGENPDREGLRDTPQRMARALREYTSGYGIDPADVLRTFEDGSERYDQMVVVRDIAFYSLCEHHMAPFFGKATIAYVPDKRIVGLSKLARLLNVYARRLQVQERMTAQVADALAENLAPLGCGVLVAARHLCMESRGVQKPGSVTITSALRGCFLLGDARAEFLSLGNSLTP